MKLSRGLSLIELMVGMAIFGVLLSLAMPSFTGWIRSAKIRTTTESVQNGLQLAKAEAVRRNTAVRFQLIDLATNSCALSVNGPHWVVSLDSAVGKCGTAASDTVDPRIVQLRNGTEGADNNTVLTAGQSSFVFNGMGRLVPTPAGSIDIDISNATGGVARALRIVISIGGQVRMCDPLLPAGDTQACS